MTIRTENEGNGYAMHRIDLIPAPEFDLIEFDINKQRIWGLWCNSQGEFNVSSFSLLPNSGSNWVTAGLEALPERKMEDDTDPRQAYCSYIFYPGRFQREVIDRALIVSVSTMSTTSQNRFHIFNVFILSDPFRCSVAQTCYPIQMYP